jgi:rhodanese-related sulfurtransferase
MKEVTVKELKKMFDSKEDFQLIDIREDYEVEIATLGGEHIPMGDVMSQTERIAKGKKVVIHCRSGKRSAAVIQALETQMGFTNLYNLQGGILAYADQVDSGLTKY